MSITLFLHKDTFMKYRIVSLLICFGIAGCHAQQEHSFAKQKSNNTLLWQVSGKGLKHPSFLFGTFHLLCKDDIHFSDQLTQALKESNEICKTFNVSV